MADDTSRYLVALCQWWPFYLHQRVITSFLLIFALLLISVEVLLALSDQNHGVATGLPSQHYLWAYGPTAILTLLVALWGRVCYQSKILAPWLRMASPPLSRDQKKPSPVSAARTLLLDYVSPMEPFAIIKALKNRDFGVFLSALVLVVIRALIVISTGLITLSLRDITHNSYPMVIQDRFFESNNTPVLDAGTLPVMVVRGLIQRLSEFPDGLSPEYAFQTVQRNVPNMAETSVVVDGLKGSLQCQVTNVTLASNRVAYPDNRVNLTIASRDCKASYELILWGFTPDNSMGFWPTDESDVLFTRLSTTTCLNGTSGGTPVAGESRVENRRMLFVAARIAYSPDGKDGQDAQMVSLSLNSSRTLLCIPQYNIGKVAVTRKDSTTISIVPSESEWNSGNSNPSDLLSAWKVVDAHFAAYKSPTNAVWFTRFDRSGYLVDTDNPMLLALASQYSPDTPVINLLKPGATSIEDLATRYFQQFTAVIAKQVLMQRASISTMGSYTMSENRLVVSEVAAHWMAGLLALCIISTTAILYLISRRRGSTGQTLPRNPGTILGIAALVSSSPSLLRKVRFLGAADSKSVCRVLSDITCHSGAVHDPISGQHHFTIQVGSNSDRSDNSSRLETSPQISSTRTHALILHPVTRGIICALLVGLIIALEVMLQRSVKGDGLGDVEDDNNGVIHYTWTLLPALVFGSLSLALSASDFQTRLMAPFNALYKGAVSPEAFTRLDLLDMSLPRAIYQEIRLSTVVALMGTLSMLLSSFFTILSSSLFQPLPIPVVQQMSLHATQSFNISSRWGTVSLDRAGVILANNGSYGRFAYEDLAFPQLEAFITPKSNADNTSSSALNVSSITATLPALRAKLESCRVYPMSDITISSADDYKKNRTSQGDDDGMPPTYWETLKTPLGIRIRGEDCALYIGKYNDILPGPEDLAYSYFAQAPQGGNTYVGVHGCSQLVYYWGKLDLGATHHDTDNASSSGDKTSPINLLHAAAMGCNVSFEVVQVQTTFANISLDLDISNAPPRRLEDTARPALISPSVLDQQLLYAGLPQVGTVPTAELAGPGQGDGVYLDPFFSTMALSPFALPSLGYLGGEGNTSSEISTDQVVINAITAQHAIIMAQVLVQHRYAPANASNATVATVVDNNGKGLSNNTPEYHDDAQPVYPAQATILPPAAAASATGTDQKAAAAAAGQPRRRVVQDGPSTRILEALLSVTLVLFGLGWISQHLHVDPLQHVRNLKRRRGGQDKEGQHDNTRRPSSVTINSTAPVLYSCPTNIAAMTSLVAGGNLLDFLPAGGEWLTRDRDLMHAASFPPGTTFRIGWGTVPDYTDPTGGLNENGISSFGIYAVLPEEDSVAGGTNIRDGPLMDVGAGIDTDTDHIRVLRQAEADQPEIGRTLDGAPEVRETRGASDAAGTCTTSPLANQPVGLGHQTLPAVFQPSDDTVSSISGSDGHDAEVQRGTAVHHNTI